MANDTRPSLSKNLEARYSTQPAGGSFDVQKTIAAAKSGKVDNFASANGQEFQTSNGFKPKVNTMDTQFKPQNASKYVKGLDTTKYKK